MGKLNRKAHSAIEYLILMGVTVAIVLVGMRTQVPRARDASNVYFEKAGEAILGQGGACGDGHCNPDFEDAMRCCVDCGGCDLTGPAPQAGGWCPWTDWTDCSTAGTCGWGEKSRTRECNCPPRLNGGSNCIGIPDYSSETSQEQITQCMVTECPIAVDGGWCSEAASDWSDWTVCTEICGGGTQEREQINCNCPPPSAASSGAPAGAACSSPAKQTRQCNTTPCTEAIDGQWCRWSGWSPCSVFCGGGTQTRTEVDCNCPPPQNGGADCPTAAVETQACNTQVCCGDGIIDNGEPCDKVGPVFDGQTCATEGFNYGGTLNCNSDCTLNTTQCIQCLDNADCSTPSCSGTYACEEYYRPYCNTSMPTGEASRCVTCSQVSVSNCHGTAYYYEPNESCVNQGRLCDGGTGQCQPDGTCCVTEYLGTCDYTECKEGITQCDGLCGGTISNKPNGTACTGGVCSNGSCVGCITDAECGGATPYCFGGSCVECMTNSHCDTNGTSCSSVRACRAYYIPYCDHNHTCQDDDADYVIDNSCTGECASGQCSGGSCVVLCGNGVLDAGEDCDGSLGLPTCQDLGYIGGTTSCSPSVCLVNISNCTSCSSLMGQSCDASPCRTNGTYDCSGNCIGATIKTNCSLCTFSPTEIGYCGAGICRDEGWAAAHGCPLI